MKRVYHPYWLWEDYKCGFYETASGEKKKQHVEKVVEMFNSAELTRKFMMMAIERWVYSCEQNLTNPAMNKIAYLGQAACCLYAGVGCMTTMTSWNLLTKEVQQRSNTIAKEVLSIWKENYKTNG